jgi:hypothetical protein
MKVKLQKLAQICFLTLFAGLVVVPAIVMAQSTPLSDSDDSIIVTTPVPNKTIRGQVATKFTLVDDDRASIPYEVSLKNTACSVAIDTIEAGTATSGQEKTTTWNSGGPLQNVSSVADGKYCLEVCAALMNETVQYSACNSRYVIIRNNNAAPVITTNPPADRTIGSNEAWSYDVNARDAEGDKLTFVLSQAPSFVKINAFTGLISVGTAYKNPGSYTITVKVSDAFGGSDTQTFTLTVGGGTSSSSSTTSKSSSSKTSTTSASSSASTSSSTGIEIVFEKPEAGDILKGKENEVAWRITGLGASSISKLSLYLLNGNNKTLLAELDKAALKYTFDVAALADGDYRLELEVETSEETFTEQSPQFKVKNMPDDGGPQQDRPLINNVKPAPDSTLDKQPRPTISGDFVAPAGTTINTASFKLLVDDIERSWCGEVTAQKFSCIPDIDLGKGIHKVRVSIEDSKKNLGVKEWTFTLTGVGDDTTGGWEFYGRIFDTQAIMLICGACLLLLVLFFVPWLLYSMWQRRQSQTVTKTTTTSNNDYYNTEQSYYRSQAADSVPDITALTPVIDQYRNTQTTTTTTEPAISPTDAAKKLGGDIMSSIAAFNPFGKKTTTTTTEKTEVVPAEPMFPEASYTPSFDAPATTTSSTTTTTVTPAEVPAAPPAPVTTTTSSADALDPLNFDSYEDYLAAVGAASSAAPVSTTTTETTTVNPASDPNYISPPDYSSEMYTASPTTTPEEPKKDDESGDDTQPDWLNPV